MRVMKIAFVFMGAESLGIEYLSAVARAAGHETLLFFDPAVFSGKLMLDSPLLARLADRRDAMARAIVRRRPDVVAFSCFTGNYQWALDVARRVRDRAPHIPLVFGGVHATAVPHRVMEQDCVDALLVGEGEAVFLNLLQCFLEQGEPPPGVWLKRNGELISSPPQPPIADPDTLPHPDKMLFYNQAPALERHYMIMTARGCPFSCTYCYKSLEAASGVAGAVRQRSVDHVIDELKPFKQRGIMKMVVFRDDVFGTRKRWLEEFCEKYPREIGLPYFCYTHPGAVDAERAAMLRNSGCTFTTMGVQSADETVRRELLNRKYTNEQVRESVRALKDQGIRVSLDHIVGVPGDNAEKLLEAAELYAELKPDRLLTFWLECFPGTRILEIVRERGLLTDDDVARIENGDSGYRYSGGTMGADDPETAAAVNFLNLIPLLPESVIRRVLQNGRKRRIPSWPWLQHMLMAANAVTSRDEFFFYNLEYMFSKKKLNY